MQFRKHLAALELNEAGTLLYRGTQYSELKGVSKLLSYATSAEIAVIYSAVPGCFWAKRPAQFTGISTLHYAALPADAKILTLGGGDNHATFSQILQELRYGEAEGITFDEARRILNYMHNRITGKAKGGEFSYKIEDEDGENPFDLDFCLRSTEVSRFRDEYFDYDPDDAGMLVADTFIFADAPAVRQVAQRLGYDAIAYEDLFEGGHSAAPQLLGVEAEDLIGVEYALDMRDDEVLVHQTVRPLKPESLTHGSFPVANLFRENQDQPSCPA